MTWQRKSCTLLLLACCSILIHAQEENEKHIVPSTDGAFFAETFETTTLENGRWVKSTVEKYASQELSFTSSKVESGPFSEDKSLILESSHKHYGLSAPLKEPLALDDQHASMVIQYEVRLTEGLECGGAYMKFLHATPTLDLALVDNESPYIIMFGPDKCGADSKIHLIIRTQNPVTAEWEEKHLKQRPTPPTDKNTHLYTLHLHDDNTYEIFVDFNSVSKGSLYDAFEPPFLPPQQIPDPNDVKPSDWVDEATIPDPKAVKPDDWDEDAPRTIENLDAVMPPGWLLDEALTINDPSAVIPEDWDNEDDGEWEAPQISNPKCAEAPGCGPWTAPRIDNPDYKGPWTAPRIDNPDYKGPWSAALVDNPAYFENEHVARLEPIGAIAFEIWTITGGISFDNIWIGYDVEAAKSFAQATWSLRSTWEKENVQESDLSPEELKASLLSDGSIWSRFRLAAMEMAEFSKKEPLISGAVGLIAFLLLCFVLSKCFGRRRSSPVHEKVEQEQQQPSAMEKKKDDSTLRQRKRAPKED